MSDTDATDPLADRLRTAAADLTPAFSPALHAAVLSRVDHARRAAGPPGRWPLAARWSAVAAAAAAIGLVAVEWPAPRHPGTDPTGRPPPAVAVSVPALPSVSAAVGTLSDAVARRVADVRHDCVDRYVDGSAAQLSRYCRAGWDLLPSSTPATDDHPASTSPTAPEAGRG